MKYFALPLTAAAILLVSNILAWGSFFMSYHAFTHEEPILTLYFEAVGKREYLAYIEASGSISGEYSLYGDQWRIDAQFVKMKYWANFLGVESRYAIDRLQGRYINVQDENSLPNIAHQLNSDGFSHFTVFGWNPFIDTEYGSSTYQIIDVEKQFTVYKTPTGLMVRAEVTNPQAKDGWFKRLWK